MEPKTWLIILKDMNELERNPYIWFQQECNYVV